MRQRPDPVDRTHLFINGQWQLPAAKGEAPVIDPATWDEVGRVGLATADDVDHAVRAARESFDSRVWASRTPAERAALLRTTADILESRQDELVDLLTSELGCPRTFAASFHVPNPIRILREVADVAERFPWDEVRRSAGAASLVHHQPVGVVGAVTPWNGPLSNPTIKIAPAVASGSSIVLKAAPNTPLTGFMLIEALVEAGLPPGVVNYVPGDRDAGRHLVAHPDVDKVAFTGSTAAGRDIMATCADRIARLTLELGGKSAAIMLDDCDAEMFVDQVLPMGLSLINGQVCVAQSRLLVSERRYAEVTELLVEKVRAMKVGDPFEDDTQVGPLVSDEQRKRVEGYVSVGASEGATIATGGGRPAMERGWYVDPTVFVNVEPSMRIAQEEIFGPVVALMSYRDDDEAVRLANDSIFGLSGSVWSADELRAGAVAKRMRTGMVSINGSPQARNTPFGGFKQSGLGREFGIEGLSAYTEVQSIAIAEQGPLGHEVAQERTS